MDAEKAPEAKPEGPDAPEPVKESPKLVMIDTTGKGRAKELDQEEKKEELK